MPDRAERADPDGLFSSEVAYRDHIGEHALVRGGPLPMEGGGKTLAGEFRICCGFVPGDAFYRVLLLSFRRRAELPAGRARTSGLIDELAHCGFARERPAVALERVLPEFGATVASGVDELLVVGVGHFMNVDPEVRHLGSAAGELRRSTTHEDHPGGDLAGSVQRERASGCVELGSCLGRHVAVVCDAVSQ